MAAVPAWGWAGPNCIPGEAMSPILRGCATQLLTGHFSIPFQTENTGENTVFYSNYKNHRDAFQDPIVFSQFLLCSSRGISAINSLSLLRAEQLLSGRVSSYVFLTVAQSLSSLSMTSLKPVDFRHLAQIFYNLNENSTCSLKYINIFCHLALLKSCLLM